MKITSIAFGLGLTLLAPVPAFSQKIIVITGASADAVPAPVRVRKFGRVTHGRFIRGKSVRKAGLPRVRFSAFALPDQTLFPPYYRSPQPYAKGPGMTSRIKAGLTSRRGSQWRSHLKGGRTVEGGSRWASRIVAGRTVERGSPWASTMPNWRFSGYAAPMRPKGIPYYRVRRARSPWASRLR